MTQETFEAARALISASLGGFLPEIVLTLFICLLFLHDLFSREPRPGRASVLALAGLGLCGITLLLQYGDPPRELFGWKTAAGAHHGMLRLDSFGWFFKLLILVTTAITIPMVRAFSGFRGRPMGEFYAMLLGATLGMFIMCGATNLLMIYLGIEFASMASYLLTAFIKGDRKGSEAGLKYVLYGSVASGLMIYGISLIYGMTGSLHLGAVAERLAVSGASEIGLIVAGILVFAGFAYKMAAFPMHLWAPDVYEGAPIPFTAYLSVASKAAGFAVFVRFLMAFGADFQGTVAEAGGAGKEVGFGWPEIVAVSSVLSMTFGNLAALGQENVKRMLAYSSVAHAGYLLMAVAVLMPGSPGAGQFGPLTFYFIAYLCMNLGAFYVATVVSSRIGSEEYAGFRGLGVRAPFLAVCMTVFLISLIGIPPTAGFSGKFQLFQAAIDGGLVWLAVAAGINTVISAFYYARFWKVMYLDGAPEPARIAVSRTSVVMISALVIPVIVLGVLGVAFSAVAAFTQQLGM